MPILRKVVAPSSPRPNIQALLDVPGHEANRILHGGSCPLRGQIQRGGFQGPFCTPLCVGPTPPIYVESTFDGLVLEVNEVTRVALVWDFLKKRPDEVRLEDDPAFPSHAEVDATADLIALHNGWKTWRAIEVDRREEARKAAEDKKARLAAEAAAKAAAETKALADAETAKEIAKLRRLASQVRPGRQLHVVADPPGFQEKNRGLKERYRTPSLVGVKVFCVEGGHGPYIFVKLPDGSTKRMLRKDVRVILPDGSLGDLDTLS